MAQLIYHPEARNELREAVRFYERQQKGLGKRFLRTIEMRSLISADFPALRDL